MKDIFLHLKLVEGYNYLLVLLELHSWSMEAQDLDSLLHSKALMAVRSLLVANLELSSFLHLKAVVRYMYSRDQRVNY